MGEKIARTSADSGGLLVVDYNSAGQAIGVEITAPQVMSHKRLNELVDAGQAPLAAQDFR